MGVCLAALSLGVAVPGTASAAMCGGYDPGLSGGDGSAASPYQIASAADLATLVSESPMWVCEFVQTADITLAAPAPGSSNLGVIGDVGTPFEGVYDGGGHSITGLTVVGSGSDYLGLFGRSVGGTIRNLTLIDPVITGSWDGSSGDVYLGSILGHGEGVNLSDLTVRGAVISGDQHLGGVAGYVIDPGTLSDFDAESTLTGPAAGEGSRMGGIVGTISSSGTGPFTMTDVRSQTTITSDSESGGVVGYLATTVEFERIVVDADITITSYGAGGIMGYNDPYAPTVVRDAYVSGSVTAVSEAGGVEGVTDDLVLDGVVVTADVTGDRSDVACFIGSADDLSDGSVSVVSAFHVGTLRVASAAAVSCGPRPSSITVTAPSLTMSAGGSVPDVDVPSAVYDADGSLVEFYEAPVCTSDDGTGQPVTSETPPGTYDIVCRGGVAWGAYVETYLAGTLVVESSGGTEELLPETGATSSSELVLVAVLLLVGGLVLTSRRRLS